MNQVYVVESTVIKGRMYSLKAQFPCCTNQCAIQSVCLSGRTAVSHVGLSAFDLQNARMLCQLPYSSITSALEIMLCLLADGEEIMGLQLLIWVLILFRRFGSKCLSPSLLPPLASWHECYSDPLLWYHICIICDTELCHPVAAFLNEFCILYSLK